MDEGALPGWLKRREHLIINLRDQNISLVIRGLHHYFPYSPIKNHDVTLK